MRKLEQGIVLLTLLMALPVSAHHSFAMFDFAQPAQVSGTAAKLEWSNPHVFVWMYVPDKRFPSGYQLYAFETGSLVLMARVGWDRHAISPGDKISVDYMPLRDGKPGGFLVRMTKSDGKVLNGDPAALQALKTIKSGEQKP